MKVIDLLNKIANGEEIPEKIIYRGYSYKYCKSVCDYGDIETNGDFFLSDRLDSFFKLNDEVETIEDTPKIDDAVLRRYFTDEENKRLNEQIKDNSIEHKDNINDYYKEEKKIEKLGAFNIKKFYDDYPETARFILEMFNKQEELIDKVNGDK